MNIILSFLKCYHTEILSLGALGTLLACFLTVTTVFFLYFQIRQQAQIAEEQLEFTKNNAHHTIFANLPSNETEKELHRHLSRSKIDPEVPIDTACAEKMIEDGELYLATVHYLNGFEELCAAVHRGTVDSELVYELDCTRIVHNYHIYAEFIRACRVKRKSNTVFLELEKTAKIWGKKRAAELKKQEQCELEEYEHKIWQQGVRPRKKPGLFKRRSVLDK